jgi:hypothetical protein
MTIKDAKQITLDLFGRWHGAYGSAACPCCQSERRRDQTALTLSDGKGGRLLLHCKKSGCSFRDILAAAGITPGSYTPPDPAIITQREAERRAEIEKRSRQARILWDEASPITGTLAEAYLRGRGITCAMPNTLRFHGDCWHGPTARRWPTMVAIVEGAEAFAVHRTYLDPKGHGKAQIEPNKMMLGCTRGGAVRLAQAQGSLVVCEGIETGLSLASGLLRAPVTVWAALSTSGIRGLCLPSSGGRITIATDGDDAGRDAGRELADRAHNRGWKVSILPAPQGRDWNDILKREVAA